MTDETVTNDDDETICPVCDGTGEALVLIVATGRHEYFGCPGCDGVGVIEETLDKLAQDEL
jgi:hypothetical protein